VHKQHFVTAHSEFITAHFVFHCTLKNALHNPWNKQQMLDHGINPDHCSFKEARQLSKDVIER